MEANNTKAMRDALEYILDVIKELREQNPKVVDAVRIAIGQIENWANAALSAPLRACDVMSQEDLTRVVISGFTKSLGIGQENQLVSQLAEAAISAAIKCAYDTQLVGKV